MAKNLIFLFGLTGEGERYFVQVKCRNAIRARALCNDVSQNMGQGILCVNLSVDLTSLSTLRFEGNWLNCSIVSEAYFRNCTMNSVVNTEENLNNIDELKQLITQSWISTDEHFAKNNCIIGKIWDYNIAVTKSGQEYYKCFVGIPIKDGNEQKIAFSLTKVWPGNFRKSRSALTNLDINDTVMIWGIDYSVVRVDNNKLGLSIGNDGGISKISDWHLSFNAFTDFQTSEIRDTNFSGTRAVERTIVITSISQAVVGNKYTAFGEVVHVQPVNSQYSSKKICGVMENETKCLNMCRSQDGKLICKTDFPYLKSHGEVVEADISAGDILVCLKCPRSPLYFFVVLSSFQANAFLNGANTFKSLVLHLQGLENGNPIQTAFRYLQNQIRGSKVFLDFKIENGPGGEKVKLLKITKTTNVSLENVENLDLQQFRHVLPFALRECGHSTLLLKANYSFGKCTWATFNSLESARECTAEIID